MKKWLFLAAALLGCLVARGQNRYYIGGDISLGASSSGTSVVVYPEVGTRIANNLYLGLAAGFDWNNYSSRSDFTMGLIPHLRGYLPLYQGFGLSADTFFSARFTRREGYEPLIKTFQLGLRPGIFIPLGGVTISTQIGFFGWTRTDYGIGSPTSHWAARLEARDILIGVLVSL
ncbi:MAG: hypothetical protein II874_10965 [Bacteroidales bacterium]|nr:hypothetical protein [Bacteroidales bacterium]